VRNKDAGIISLLAELTKYKLSLAVVLSAVTGYFLNSNIFNNTLLFLACGVFLLSSGAAALNQYTERLSDGLMERTRYRPVPSKRISERAALGISIILIVSGALLLYRNGIMPLLLGLVNVFMYNLVYTRLKKKSLFSIIPGALVGAIPPIIGFSSSGGSLNHPYILAFSTFMFLWQLPHFWLLLIKYGNEYNAAGFATLSNVLAESEIRQLVFVWVVFSTSLLLIFFALADSLSSGIFVPTALLNILFIFLFHRLLFRKKYNGEIKGAFIVINLFSLLVMLLIIGASIFNII